MGWGGSVEGIKVSSTSVGHRGSTLFGDSLQGFPLGAVAWQGTEAHL